MAAAGVDVRRQREIQRAVLQPPPCARTSRAPSSHIGGSAARRRIRWRAETAAGRSGCRRNAWSSGSARRCPAASRCCISCSTGLASTSTTSSPSRNSGTTFMARRHRPSGCRALVPVRPAAVRLGWPWSCQTCTHHRPSISPNIWLISGAVMKSPPRRTDRASRNSRLRIVQRQGHVLRDRDRALRRDQRGDALRPARSCRACGFCSATSEQRARAPARPESTAPCPC